MPSIIVCIVISAVGHLTAHHPLADKEAPVKLLGNKHDRLRRNYGNKTAIMP